MTTAIRSFICALNDALSARNRHLAVVCTGELAGGRSLKRSALLGRFTFSRALRIVGIALQKWA